MSLAKKLPRAPVAFPVLREHYADAAREAFPLIRAHGNEIGADALPVPFAPDLDMPAEMERQGLADWLSVRDEAGAMIGYALIYYMPSPLFAGRWQATCQATYVDPAYRGPALLRTLWREILDAARERGAVAVLRDSWTRKGGRRPRQMVSWTFLEE
jgi:GNAT superfamily N-acetyltransferase